ncbi:MAG: response regulator [Oscillospiraceae bacterium]|nr:response regulator [Oscillospiraceae bacterium]
MAQDRKQLLIVDDTEIDRIILKSILAKDFNIFEANSGNVAFEYLTTQGDRLDGILLDISMPHIDGFDVLKFMADKDLLHIPVFLVTAEPTLDNVQRAMQYHVAEFIGKPFDRDDVLRRLRSRLGLTPVYNLKAEDLKITKDYIADLEDVYKRYLANFGKNDTHYIIMSDVMRILLNYYNKYLRDDRMTNDTIDLVCKAAYFCDIGEMLIPDKRLQLLPGAPNPQDLAHSHTQLGSKLIRLNRSPSCEYFVEVCASMCLHHHERYDGQGYPDGLNGECNSLFNQLCHLVDEFEKMRSKFYGDKAKPVKFVVKRLVNDDPGLVSAKVAALLEDCEPQIFDYFTKKSI